MPNETIFIAQNFAYFSTGLEVEGDGLVLEDPVTSSSWINLIEQSLLDDQTSAQGMTWQEKLPSGCQYFQFQNLTPADEKIILSLIDEAITKESLEIRGPLIERDNPVFDTWLEKFSGASEAITNLKAQEHNRLKRRLTELKKVVSNPIIDRRLKFIQVGIHILDDFFALSKNKRKPTKPRRIDEFPKLKRYKNDAFGPLREKLFRDFRLLVSEIFPTDSESTKAEKQYLINSFIDSARKTLPGAIREGHKVGNPSNTKRGQEIIIIPK